MKVSIGNFDQSCMYCSTAAYYDSSRIKLFEKYIPKLVSFQFAWGALETIISKFVEKNRISKFGKINALCMFLKDNEMKKHLPNGYIAEVKRLLKLLKTSYEYRPIAEKLYNNEKINLTYNNKINEAGCGIFIIYKIRNKLAHGSLSMPEPVEFTDPKINEIKLIERCTRIVLMTIQIIFINDFTTVLL